VERLLLYVRGACRGDIGNAQLAGRFRKRDKKVNSTMRADTEASKYKCTFEGVAPKSSNLDRVASMALLAKTAAALQRSSKPVGFETDLAAVCVGEPLVLPFTSCISTCSRDVPTEAVSASSKSTKL
jgi:hypothetical protein